MSHVFQSLCLSLSLLGAAPSIHASIAYGSINNFDTVNDTGHVCHGFEIELEDCHSTDITYTYDYNHYGVPRITQDDSVPGHPKCVIRWESRKNPDGTWAAFTAIPSEPIAPTDGHQFTNPNVNFGGEHFGVGYFRQPTAVRYHWLIDDGSGALVHGGAVQVATPTFTYYPPAAGVPGRVQAAIDPPEPPEVPQREFGDPVWVKEIRTTSHNNRKVALRDLVSDDPEDADDVNWRNGEPDEVEVEWQLLQTEFSKVDGGANGELQAAPEDLPQGDEVVTRRYEFFKYTGPIDAESGEAKCDNVGADDLHGEGVGEVNGVEVDFSTLEVVGDFTGAQMAAVEVDAGVGLTEHLGDGRVGQVYPERRLVIPGATPFESALTGSLPPGLAYDPVEGLLTGMPEEPGAFTFTVSVSDATTPAKEKTYTLLIADEAEEVVPCCLLDTSADPVGGGTTSGSDAYDVDAPAVASAVANPGYRFVKWTEGGADVSVDPEWTLSMNVNRSLVAVFAPTAAPWTVTAAASPAAGGVMTGGGQFAGGATVTLIASPAAGFVFTRWVEAGVEVSVTPRWEFVVDAHRSVQAVFSPIPGGGGSTLPKAADAYSVTDITGWNAADLAELPYFDRFVATPPPGAPVDFQAKAQNGFGTVAGNRDTHTSFVQGSGAVVRQGLGTTIASWGQYAWSHTYWDGEDVHFSNGFVEHSPATDVAFSGKVIGFANLPGVASGPAASTGYRDHGYLFDPATGLMTDVTPDAVRAELWSLNDLDEVVGLWRDDLSSHAFVRRPDGSTTELAGLEATTVVPLVVNNRGLIAGTYSTASMQGQPFVAADGTTLESLGVPAQGGVDTATITDANDHGLIVGRAWRAGAAPEPSAVRWYREDETWVAEDLNEVLETEGFIVDSALAVNDAGYIMATGHADGTDALHTRTLLLTPDKVPPPAAVTLPVIDVEPTRATVRAKLNACSKTTDTVFHMGTTAGYGTTISAAEGPVSGMHPALRTAQLAKLAPGTTYHVRVSATSSKGTTHGENVVFSTPHTLASWTSLHFAEHASDPAVAGPESDPDQDGRTNFGEFAFGHDPLAADADTPDASLDADGFTISYTRPIGVSGVIYTIEVATSLEGPWESGPGVTETLRVQPAGSQERITVRSLLFTDSHPRQFLVIRARPE